MYLVDLGEQGVAHFAAWELPHEVLRPVLQRETRLHLQRLCVDEPLDFVRLQKIQAEALSSLKALKWH